MEGYWITLDLPVPVAPTTAMRGFMVGRDFGDQIDRRNGSIP